MAGIEGYAVLLGLTLLTVFLLLGAVAQFYSQGVYWDWARTESRRLLAWLVYAVVWCVYVLLGWRGRRLWVLAALGAVPALLALPT
jgi:ABC-type transport system involved in cytochrome c biogenesis permease subunit